MKTDFTFFCRTWIGIAYASGEDTSALAVKVWSASSLVFFMKGKVELTVYTDFQQINDPRSTQGLFLEAQSFILVKLRS